jgi:predicted Rossmann fold nucleotide-binding protein DprA/Smf involved in DNA uptake
MLRTVTITGTRSTEHHDVDNYRELFGTYLAPFADVDARFYIGGACGIDSLALDWLTAHTAAAITVAVPCAVADQPIEAQQAISKATQRPAGIEVVELNHQQLGAESYHARNRWMVDRSSLVIGFPYGDDQRSGTWYTLNYAAEHGKARLIIPV